MTNPTANNHRPISKSQIQLLLILYKFRFATTHLIAQSKGTKYPRVIYSRLKILIGQDYVGRRYDSSYRIKGKRASYFLLPKGIATLKQQPGLDPKVLKSLYNDRQAADRFIDHCLAVFDIYIRQKSEHGEQLKFFTKSELGQFKYFPKPLPDAYMIVGDKSYFVDYFEESVPFFVTLNRIKKYIAYDESTDWEQTNSAFPKVSFFCSTEEKKRQLIRQINKLSPQNIKFEVVKL